MDIQKKADPSSSRNLPFRALIGTFRRQGLRSLLLYALLMALLIWIGVFCWVRLQKNSHSTDLENFRNSLQSQSEDIASIPAPDKIEKGQIDSALGFIINRSNDLADQQSPELPPSSQLLLHRLWDSEWRNNVGLLREIRQVNMQRNDLLQHHAEVLEIVGQVLRYNPQADLSSETLPANEISGRINAAQEGISDVESALKSIRPYSEADDIEALKAVLTDLQTKLKYFDSNRDKNAWYAAVSASQDKIITNRHSFWTNELQRLLEKYALLNQQLSALINEL